MISQKQLFVTVVGLASTLSLFLGSVLLFWTPALLSIHLRTTLPIVSENSVVFDAWHNPMTKNVRVRRQFWVFTILNPKQVCDGKRPQLQRRGPYVYERRRIRARDTISWIGHSIITYRYGDEYIFLREESIDARTGEQLDENDVITVYSIAFFSTVYRLSKFVIQRRGLNYTPVSQFIALSLIKCFSENPQDLTILEETSVSDFIWGEMEDAYLDKLSNFVNSLKLGIYVPKHIRLQYRESIPAPFTLYRDKPGETDQIIGKMCPVVDDLSDCPTSSNSFSGMYTGMSQPKDAGKLYMYNGLKRLPWWGPGGCSTLHDSTEGVQHRPGLQRTDRIKLFIDAIARSVEFRYDGEVRVRDVDGYRYVLSDETFQSQYTNPENECYFQHWQGFLNLTSVFFFPVYLSKPFFIGVEDRSRIRFDLVNEEVFASVEQDSLQWDSFLDINPLTGMPLQHKVSFQANMRIQSNAKGSLTSPTRNLADTLVPILLVTDWAVLSEEAAHPFHTLVRPALRLGRIIGCSLLLVSFILAVISWWLWVRAWPTRIEGGSSEHLHLELLIPEDPMSENRVHLHAR